MKQRAGRSGYRWNALPLQVGEAMLVSIPFFFFASEPPHDIVELELVIRMCSRADGQGTDAEGG